STIEQADRQAAQQLAAQRRRAAELEAEHYSLVAELRADTERTKAELYEKSSAELEERRARLERTYAEAQETLKAEYDELRTALTKEHEKLMAEARTEATRIVRDANEHADKTRREIIEKADSRLAAAEARATELHELHELLTKRFAAAHEATQRAVENLALPHDFTADAEQTQPAKTQVREDQAGQTVPGQALPADQQTLSLTSKADGGQRRW
ncbi:MAG: hypothetical protein J2O44_07990, partial [Porphyrobacter sp.]|nr:hypothetical protein [Porphyrobacter sp.]